MLYIHSSLVSFLFFLFFYPQASVTYYSPTVSLILLAKPKNIPGISQVGKIIVSAYGVQVQVHRHIHHVPIVAGRSGALHRI
ncbi:hypothetical protein ACN38_g1736 [Penicillium nordicum]|uniref:Secreted protein n=1 Tax=Penicillium nordicum TaxID=229535 RepID=A0A0M8PB28_9EURO|nr:hypothetical protein ACN38_g1736 [Penicillium nordicum]